MKTPLKITGTIFLLLLLTLSTMPGVHAISPIRKWPPGNFISGS